MNHKGVKCIDCGWIGELDDLLSDSWDDFRYCPKCNNDETEDIIICFNCKDYDNMKEATAKPGEYTGEHRDMCKECRDQFLSTCKGE